MKILIPSLLFLLLFSCESASQLDTANNKNTKTIALEEPVSNNRSTAPEPSHNLVPIPKNINYPWLDQKPVGNTLVNRIAVPEGYNRIAVSTGSFSEWLRHLPLKEGRGRVKLFNGDYKRNQSAHEAIINMDVQNADLQQCADAIMRLKAEYHYSRKEYEDIHFNYTSGDQVSFEDWRKGKRPKVIGNKVKFVNNGKVSDQYTNFRDYLTQIFTYAGTASLTKELKRKSIEEIQAGDLFIQGGFPGHAILVLDVAVNEQGERIFLTGQSYMPAQEFHLLKNENDMESAPWYKVNSSTDLDTPEWVFQTTDLREW